MGNNKHVHIWSDWKDDKKPLNLESQKELILLSARHCTVNGCDQVQFRIGRITEATQERKEALDE